LAYVFNNIKHPQNFIKFLQFGLFFLFIKRPLIKPAELSGHRMFIDINSHADRNIFFNGTVDVDLVTFLKKRLQTGSVFFDIGANSGFFSLIASKIIKNGSIHAFEPVPAVYKNLLESSLVNSINNIQVNNICLSNKTGFTPFYVSYNSDVSSIKKNSNIKKEKKIKVKTLTLLDYCKKNAIKKIDIIKIDTEGSEKNILFPSGSILKKFKPMLIVEFSNKNAKAFDYHPNEVYDFLVKIGYKIYSFKNGKLSKQKKLNYYSDNLYCLYGKN